MSSAPKMTWKDENIQIAWSALRVAFEKNWKMMDQKAQQLPFFMRTVAGSLILMRRHWLDHVENELKQLDTGTIIQAIRLQEQIQGRLAAALAAVAGENWGWTFAQKVAKADYAALEEFARGLMPEFQEKKESANEPVELAEHPDSDPK